MKLLLLSLLLFGNTLFALEKVSLQLHWKYQFEFAGFIMAKEKGFYKDVGLDVELKEYKNGMNIIDTVLNKETTYGIYNSNLLLSYLQNKPIKLIASFFKRPALVIITQPSIKTPQDLIGKTIMTHSKEDFDFNFKYMFNKENIDTTSIHFIKHSYRVDEFADGKVDALTAFISDEPYKLDKKNIDYNIINPADYGLYNLQLELFTSELEASKHPKRVDDFKEASMKGWEYALNHKEETIDIIYQKYSQHISKDALTHEAKIIDKLVLQNIYKVGSIDNSFLHRQFELFTKDLKIVYDVDLNDFIFDKKQYQTNLFKLSKEEKHYLKIKKEITACIDPYWMPFEAFENGKHIGLSSDYLKIFEQELQIPIKVIPTKSWVQTLEFAKKRVCDIVPLIIKNRERKKFLNFTSPLLNTSVVIATKLNTNFIIDFKSLKNKTIGITKGYALADELKRKYSYLNIVEINSLQDGMEQVTQGKIYGVVGSIGTIWYMIQRKYLGQLKINGKLDESLSVPMGIRNDEPLLTNIFQKLIDNISQIEHDTIFDKWVSKPIKREFDYTILYQIIALFLIILFILSFFFNKQRKLKDSLSILVDKKTLILQQQNEQLQHLLENFQDLLDTTLEVIIISDENHKIIDINRSGSELFGIAKKEEMIGMSLLDIVPKSAIPKVMEALENPTQKHYEITIQTFDGKVITLLAGGQDSIRDGKKVRISSILDITELKNKDEQLLQQAKLAQMGEMVSMIAHQWRQPLNAISAASIHLSLLANMKMLEDCKVIQRSEFIQDQCQEMSRTIDTFMNFIKPTQRSTLFKPIESMNSILDIMGIQLKNHNIVVKISTREDDIVLSGYEDLLEQVIINILSNSRDAFEELNIANKSIDIEISRDKESIIITIKDNAGGIPKDIADKIFNPYFTTKEQGKGTGIGLYMSKDIMKKSFSGDLVYQAIENGSCFKIICRDIHTKNS